MSKKRLIVLGAAFTGVGLLLFSFRQAFAVAFLRLVVYGTATAAHSDYWKIQVFAYGGGIIFLIGVAALVMGISKD